jgi:hypothetical protein
LVLHKIQFGDASWGHWERSSCDGSSEHAGPLFEYSAVLMAQVSSHRNLLSHASPTDTPAKPSRAPLLVSSIALVEDLHSPGVPTKTPPEDYSAVFQVCFPYSGAFTWHVGHDHVLGDPNQVLFVKAGEAFRVSQPQYRDFGELIVTLQPTLLAELLETDEQRLTDHALFITRFKFADSSLQRARGHVLHALHNGAIEQVAAEETMLALLRKALMAPAARRVGVDAAPDSSYEGVPHGAFQLAGSAKRRRRPCRRITCIPHECVPSV